MLWRFFKLWARWLGSFKPISESNKSLCQWCTLEETLRLQDNILLKNYTNKQKKTVFLVEKPEIWNITSSDVQENSNLNGQRNLLTYDIK